MFKTINYISSAGCWRQALAKVLSENVPPKCAPPPSCTAALRFFSIDINKAKYVDFDTEGGCKMMPEEGSESEQHGTLGIGFPKRQALHRKLLFAVDDSEDSSHSFEWSMKNMYRPGSDALHFLHVMPSQARGHADLGILGP